jgi:hypothetical protein
MMTDGSGVQAGIDATEKHAQARAYHVGQSLSRGLNYFLPGWFEGQGSFSHQSSLFC